MMITLIIVTSKHQVAYQRADEEIRECIDEAEELGENLADYEVLELRMNMKNKIPRQSFASEQGPSNFISYRLDPDLKEQLDHILISMRRHTLVQMLLS